MLTCLIDSFMQNMADADESLRAFFDGCLEYPELCSLANATGDPVTSDDLLAELNTLLEELLPIALEGDPRLSTYAAVKAEIF